ncbi:MAG: polysaccharide pyruvyl transferase family protein [Kofleriaceae bacterium]|nr:polysaccharide pyruvyl transferase family protein [Kofleriaceae bacterium]
MQAERIRRIGISGSYGGYNLGDEAILEVIIRELRRTLPVEITVFSRDARDTHARHNVEAVTSRGLTRRESRRLVEKLDLLILGGGGILHDADAEMFLREVTLAYEVGTPVMVYAIGAGPLADVSLRSHVRENLDRVTVLTVRDRRTRQLLEDIGVEHEVFVTADPALLLEPAPLTLDAILRAEALDPEARLIGFSVREPGPAAPELQIERYHQLVANAADFMCDRLDAEVVFIPLERRTHDVQHSHAVVGRMRHAQRATVLKGEYAPGQILSLLGHFEFTVGMRLHFLIMSALAGVPFFALPYATKVSGFLEELGLDVPNLYDVSAGQLIASLDRAWDDRDAQRRHVREALPALQRRARINNELAVGLLLEPVHPVELQGASG